MKRIATLMILLIALALPAAAQEYADGIYRGFYYDGGIEQIGLSGMLFQGLLNGAQTLAGERLTEPGHGSRHGACALLGRHDGRRIAL